MKNLSLTGFLFLFFVSSVDAQKIKKVDVVLHESTPQHFLVRLTVHKMILTINDSGAIVDINGKHGQVAYTDFDPALMSKRIKSIGNWSVAYYDNNWQVESQKVESIGNIKIQYYPAGWGLRTGKIRAIGNVSLDYYSQGWGSTIEGKLSLINKLSLLYYPEGWSSKSGRFQKIKGTDNKVSVTVL